MMSDAADEVIEEAYVEKNPAFIEFVEGQLPADAGVIVMNVSTDAGISHYLKTGIPLTQKRITIDGDITAKPCNIFAPIGTPFSDILSFAQCDTSRLKKLIAGGPMMGACAFDPDTPLSKTNNAVLLFSDAPRYAESPCIRCGRCIRACSLNLMPTELEHAYDTRNAELLKKLKVNLCMNCGACSFVCPARRSLAEKNQLAKDFLRQQEAAKNGK